MLIFLLLYLIFVQLILPQSEKKGKWFEFNPYVSVQTNNVISMKSWLDIPAGKHGFVKLKKDKLFFEDGTPIKFWGTNISSNNVFPKKKDAETWSKTFAMFGVNSVRFHKFTAPGMLDSISTNLKNKKYDRLDYFSSKLKEKGIYYGWSPIYGHKPKQADSSSLLAYNEIVQADLNNHLSYSTIGLVNFAEDLQNLHIKLVLNLLNHKNEYTGLKYADDPALIFVELQNEDDIYFATTEVMIERCSTYKKLLTNKFCKWLKTKYSNQNNLKKAWGKNAFIWGKEIKNISWNLDSSNITPIVNHGIYDYEYKKAVGNKKPLPRFLTDMATFLFEEQNRYYKKFVKAIRSTGYKGLIISSNWQAGSGVSHYYNLYSDYSVGMIDRHNYFGGGTGHTLKNGKFNNASMLENPGSGLLSTGFQQVIDRPFSISEWLSIIPNEWTAEASPIVAAYGMGLQGWDASFSFDSQSPYFTSTIQLPNKHWQSVYNVMSPTNLSLYPAISRMIYRNDIQEGKVISKRYVSLQQLAKGEIDFSEDVNQESDIKKINGAIPNNALAVGKVVVAFSEGIKKTKEPNLSEFTDTENKIIKSNTNELEWNYSGRGYFTINTEGTKGIVGFTNGKRIKIDYLSLQTKNPFAVVLLTSLEKGKSIAESKHILITTMARVKNNGMKYDSDKTELMSVGSAPILLEPEDVEIYLTGYKIMNAKVLDHIGNPTDKKITFKRNSIILNGKSYKTMYYELFIEKL